MNKHYLVVPGIVRSKNDGQYHYIDATKLIHLYKVDPKRCVVYDKNIPVEVYNQFGKLIRLSPRDSGDYSLPEES